MTLPTTPGRYLDKDGELWTINPDGTWNYTPEGVREGSTYYPTPRSIVEITDREELEYFGPYTPENGDPEKREAIKRIIWDPMLGHRDPAELVDEIMAVFA